ncbi:aminoglycoside phosphotransferase [Croceicoccus estronivorus]|uniref:phosphotransferase family protein n=1 Tax=Croceicoccus estronivorus TaxID=1172626 RepID=UPI00083274F8|nr:phosphotransferase family protein [Croceicoccus estronivorus]OCC23551.1 aminoglycoside phosphotransferase [Croceicoccus estronivorus]
MPAIPSDPLAALTDAVRRRFGAQARVDNLTQATLGGSNRTLLFDLVEPAGTRRLVSREETFSDKANPFLPPDMQFRIMTTVHRSGIPVPEPVFAYDEQDALGPGFVTAFVSGETLPRRLLADTTNHSRILAQLADALVRLHALDLDDFAFLREIPESGDPVAALAMRLDSIAEPHPALELGLRWLETHRPDAVAPAMVHGDFRNGNFMIGPEGLAALLDWECSFIGDGAADLGWLCTRSWRFGAIDRHAGGFGTRDDLIAAYRAAGGRAITPEEIRWWEVHGLIRWGFYNGLQGLGHVNGRRSPAYAACGRNAALMEYDLLMTLSGTYD